MFSATETYTTAASPVTLPRPAWLQLDRAEGMPDTLRCAYASKRCDNARTIKKSGGLHRFCAFHRDRANRNQWRVDHRRRMLKKKRTAPNMACTATAVEKTCSLSPLPRPRGRSPRCLVDAEEIEAEAEAHARREARRRNDTELDALSMLDDAYDVCSSREATLNQQDVAILRELLWWDDVASSPCTFHPNMTLAWPDDTVPVAESTTLQWWSSDDVATMGVGSTPTASLYYAATV